MVGLDLTHQALATPELQDRVRSVGGPISQFILDIWAFVGDAYQRTYEFASPPVHDACCVVALIDPTVLTVAKADVRVELNGQWTKGVTVTNFESVPGMRHRSGTAAGQTDFRTNVATHLDWPRFADLIVDAVERLTTRSHAERG